MKAVKLDPIHTEFGNTSRDILLKIDLDKEIVRAKDAEAAIKAEAGFSIELELDPEIIPGSAEKSHILYAFLKNKAGEVISTGQVDLDTELIIKSAVLKHEEIAPGKFTWFLRFFKENGEFFDCNIDDLVKDYTDKITAEAKSRKDGDILESYRDKIGGQTYNLPYYFTANFDANKSTVTAYSIALDGTGNLRTDAITVPSANYTTAGLESAADKRNLDAVRNLLRGDNSHTGTEQIRIPYYFDMTAEASDIKVTARGVSLDKDNNIVWEDTPTVRNTLTVPAATASEAGLESAQDKINLDKLESQVPTEGAIRLLGNEAESGEPYHFTYYYDINRVADKITANVYTITLDNNRTLGSYHLDIPAATEELAGLMTKADKIEQREVREDLTQETADRTAADETLQANLNIEASTRASEDIRVLTESKAYTDQEAAKKVDLPNEPIAGQGVNVPYYFDVAYEASKVTVTDYTVDLLDKNKAPKQFSIDINAANSEKAGLMSAADKIKLDTTIPGSIETEKQERITADNSLQNNINIEASARIAADENLENKKLDKTGEYIKDDNDHEFSIVYTSPTESTINTAGLTIIKDVASETMVVSMAANQGSFESGINTFSKASFGGQVDLYSSNGSNTATLGVQSTLDSTTIMQQVDNNSMVLSGNDATLEIMGSGSNSITVKNYVDDLVTTEKERAIAIEGSLQAGLASEISARASADTALGEEIVQVALGLSSVIGSVAANLSTEVSIRGSEVNRLDERINNLQSLGRYLSTWNATTGLPGTFPTVPPTATYPYDYEYKAGDYFIITNVSETGTKYKPDGTKITKETAESTWTVGKVEESETIKENDYYIFDGTNWHLIINTQRTVTFSSIAGSARDNLNLKVELEKVDTIYKKEGTTAATGLLVDEITARTSDIASVRAELSAAIASEVSARNTAIASAKTEAISAAASDATTKANTAEANAKAYTYSQSDIDNKDNAVLASAKSYTDSKISAEVTARNTAIASAKSEAIASAASYTDACIVSEVSARNTAIGSAISALSAEVSGMAASKTLKTLAEADGKISATFEDIKISVSQITDLSLLDTAVTLSETIYTDQVVGKIHGSAQQAAKVGDKGDSLNKVFHNIFGTVTETQPTIIAEPSISVSFSTVNAELGTKINSVNYTITTEDGKYTYEDITGVNFTKYTLSGACAQIDKTTKTGTVNLSNDYYIGDTAISFNCVGEHSAGNIAKTNLGNASNPPVQITAGTKTTSATFSSAGYVPSLIMLSATLPENFDGAKVRATTIKGTQTISGGSSSTYMYLIVPTTTTINSIKASGFDVPFSQVEASKSYIVNNNRSANFRVYKTDGAVTADTFVIA